MHLIGTCTDTYIHTYIHTHLDGQTSVAIRHVSVGRVTVSRQEETHTIVVAADDATCHAESEDSKHYSAKPPVRMCVYIMC